METILSNQSKIIQQVQLNLKSCIQCCQTKDQFLLVSIIQLFFLILDIFFKKHCQNFKFQTEKAFLEKVFLFNIYTCQKCMHRNAIGNDNRTWSQFNQNFSCQINAYKTNSYPPPKPITLIQWFIKSQRKGLSNERYPPTHTHKVQHCNLALHFISHCSNKLASRSQQFIVKLARCNCKFFLTCDSMISSQH